MLIEPTSTLNGNLIFGIGCQASRRGRQKITCGHPPGFMLGVKRIGTSFRGYTKAVIAFSSLRPLLCI